MKICIAGKNSIAVDGLKYVLAKESIPKENLLILPGPEDTGIDDWQPSLLKFAQAVLVFSFIGALMVSASILLIHEIKKVFNLNK